MKLQEIENIFGFNIRMCITFPGSGSIALFFSYICFRLGFPKAFPGRRMKRESGASPQGKIPEQYPLL